MKARRTASTLTAALISATLLASPLAFAGDKGDKENRGYDNKRQHAELCEKFERGDWEQKREQYRQKAGERHEAMAERLQLTDEQREIWDEMRQERQQKHERRFEKMKERCKNQSEE
ncbi:hypothetical protein [Marinobacter sp.]|uniref:hypothetical protein n=1 Tax=Marinobacter sp. TaxID=50741 RepID=UPI00356A4790